MSDNSSSSNDKESAAQLIDPRANPPAVDRASESIMSSQVDKLERDGKADPPKQTSAISSGQIEIGGPESLINEDAPPLSSSSPAASIPPPPSTIIANAMGRNQKVPLRTIVLIGVGVVVVLIGLSLLLFW